MKRAAVLGAALFACAHAAPRDSRKLEFTEPVVITAGPPEQALLGNLDEATLFDVGTRAFQAGDYAKASAHFERLLSSFPASSQFLPALWNAGLSAERLGRYGDALERFARYLGRSDEVDAQFHAAVAEYKLGRLDDAAKRLDLVAQRPGISPQRRGEALVQEGVCRVESGARTEGERLLRQALQVFDKELADEAVDPALPAQAEFWLGEAYRGYFQDSRLDPGSMDEAKLTAALETKAEFLLSAQGHYLRAVRKGDGEWATAAGFRIGALYEELHDELVGARLPEGLTQDQRAIYQEELHKKVKNLVSKAIRLYEQTLDTAQRVGAQNPYVEKTQEALARLRKLLLDPPTDTPPDPARPASASAPQVN